MAPHVLRIIINNIEIVVYYTAIIDETNDQSNDKKFSLYFAVLTRHLSYLCN